MAISTVDRVAGGARKTPVEADGEQQGAPSSSGYTACIQSSPPLSEMPPSETSTVLRLPLPETPALRDPAGNRERSPPNQCGQQPARTGSRREGPQYLNTRRARWRCRCPWRDRRARGLEPDRCGRRRPGTVTSNPGPAPTADDDRGQLGKLQRRARRLGGPIRVRPREARGRTAAGRRSPAGRRFRTCTQATSSAPSSRYSPANRARRQTTSQKRGRARGFCTVTTSSPRAEDDQADQDEGDSRTPVGDR